MDDDDPYPDRWSQLIGRKPCSDRGSNLRRLWSRLSIMLAALLLAEASLNVAQPPLILAIALIFTSVWSISFFGIVVFIQPLRTSPGFAVNAQRLLLDTLISASMLIPTFALAYRLLGMNAPGFLMRDVLPTDAIYFSAVTFSTLGFGDFAPLGWSRSFAAVEALIGNVHLGFVVGAIFAIVGRGLSRT
ncbi:MAG: potassium channel family protein [Pseudomonadota bacterium]